MFYEGPTPPGSKPLAPPVKPEEPKLKPEGPPAPPMKKGQATVTTKPPIARPDDAPAKGKKPTAQSFAKCRICRNIVHAHSPYCVLHVGVKPVDFGDCKTPQTLEELRHITGKAIAHAANEREWGSMSKLVDAQMDILRCIANQDGTGSMDEDQQLNMLLQRYERDLKKAGAALA